MGARLRACSIAKLDLAEFGLDGQPLHVVVADAADRCRSALVLCHVWPGTFPPGSFVRLATGIYLCSPEMSFLQMAAELSLVELIIYGYELCSTYAYDKSEEGFRTRQKPLTTVARLTKFVEKAGSPSGVKKALRALRFIADGSASPMETIVPLALCLPRMIGGYGLDLPELNARLEAHGNSLVNRSHFKCDLFWRKSRIAIEYDSREHHTAGNAPSLDSSRRSALLSQGVTAISLTPEQFFDARRFDEVARAVAKHTGKRLPSNNARWMMKRFHLRKELLASLSTEHKTTS